MGQTVIDLVSSPEQPPKRPAALSAAPTPAKKQPLKAASDGFVELSSSGDEGLQSPRLTVKAAPRKTAAATCAKASTATTVAEPAVATSSKADTSSGGATGPASGLVTGSTEFHFLSDDFDSTVNLDSSRLQPDDDEDHDDPFADDLPPFKKRKVSPPPTIPEPAKRLSAGPAFKKAASRVLESDPVVFTSSPDPFVEAARRRAQKRSSDKKYDSEEDVFEDIGRGGNFRGKGHTLGSAESDVGDDGSDSDLPDIAQLPLNPIPKLSRTSSSQRALDKYNADKLKEKATKEKAPKVKTAKEKTTKGKVDLSKSKEEKAAAQAEKAKEKAAAKAAEKEAKAIEKERKKHEKELAAELAKVNLLKTDKKVSTPEMIVDLPSSLNPILREQTSTMLRALSVEHTTCESEVPLIKWRRKVEAEYDADADHYVPVAKYIRDESHAMCVLTAQALVNLITGPESGDLDAHVLKLQTRLGSCKIIYLIEGYNTWMKKNKNKLIRQYDSAVRSHDSLPDGPQNASQKSRRKKKEPDYVAEEQIEDAMLRLQIVHEVLIHHTNSMVETAEWIVNFTQHISSVPYKTQKFTLDTAFCVDTGQVKTGLDAADTYQKMLEQIQLVTPAAALGIMDRYPTVPELVRGLREDGPGALQECRKASNRNGSFADRKVGPAISKRVWKVFLGTDPDSWDV
ncbi:uncharacterized protein L3040_001554 [Drepanopeziza brunnea f. sp. 'multigermtubi']|uniref:ERCC4 domain-containing protein n=1 Tax=Marssonina brunnea f. sp. multigermtubi (strain MB_m1) TaxID=1072389 RepID=K1WQE5_MARBU|nr:ERCC4 domain-containing protein [Drepanopeziza brunnea f. sp. 'multigermtubi' MB_m1]EKD15186.1 ERCC4 domain-containing protein [Drepanopeziza brunnea f. sp. 'multigermtubi' MB_m1]KAJ5051783.1 hypothetical protein L3040_001554 [Drepanopeziza brunnea f. sp. 'multigermtubi']